MLDSVDPMLFICFPDNFKKFLSGIGCSDLMHVIPPKIIFTFYDHYKAVFYVLSMFKIH